MRKGTWRKQISRVVVIHIGGLLEYEINDEICEKKDVEEADGRK